MITVPLLSRSPVKTRLPFPAPVWVKLSVPVLVSLSAPGPSTHCQEGRLDVRVPVTLIVPAFVKLEVDLERSIELVLDWTLIV